MKPAARRLALTSSLVGAIWLVASTPTSAMQEGAVRESILVHVTHGPEDPTRAALGFAVAAAAAQKGHEVSVFLAGDGVQLLRPAVVSHLNGLGTGSLAELVDTLVSLGARFYVSAGSSAARGLREEEIAVPSFEMAGPARLLELALTHDRMFVY